VENHIHPINSKRGCIEKMVLVLSGAYVISATTKQDVIGITFVKHIAHPKIVYVRHV